MRHPVLFKAEDHIYTCNGEKYESVSGLWKPYAAPFDGMSISIKKAFSDLDPSAYKQAKSELGYKSDKLISRIYEISSVSKLDIDLKSKFYRDQWAAKAQSGTDFHEAHENIDRAAGGRINSFTGEWTNMINWPIREGYSNQSYEGDMMDLPDGYIVELLVKDDKYKLAGQADQAWIETIGGVRYIDLDDWKTDKEINVKPSYFERGVGYRKLYYPFDHLYDTNHWKYALKISTYAKMMERKGFVVRNLAFTHVTHDEDNNILTQKRYAIPYKSYEVGLALAEREKSLKKVV